MQRTRAALFKDVRTLNFDVKRLELALAAIELATTLEGAKYIAKLALETDRDSATAHNSEEVTQTSDTGLVTHEKSDGDIKNE